MYSQHAVDRMQPSGLGSPAGTVGPGRNITPNMVESVIKEGTPQNSVVNGVTRTTYWSGDVGVVTENNSNIIVTIPILSPIYCNLSIILPRVPR